MKYNKSYKEGKFEDYIAYLQTIKDRISKDLFDFISDPQRHDLGEKSLHDCHINKIEYEYASGGNYHINLLLSNSNRSFKIQFNNVSQTHISQVNFGDMYKDLITYEVGIEEDVFKNEKIMFRALFAFEEGIIEVYSEHIEIEENTI